MPNKPPDIPKDQMDKLKEWFRAPPGNHPPGKGGAEGAKRAISGANPIPEGLDPAAARKMLEFSDEAIRTEQNAAGSQTLRSEAIRKWLPEIEARFAQFIASMGKRGIVAIGALLTVLGALVWVISLPRTAGDGTLPSDRQEVLGGSSGATSGSAASAVYDPSRLSPSEREARKRNEEIVRQETLGNRASADVSDDLAGRWNFEFLDPERMTRLWESELVFVRQGSRLMLDKLCPQWQDLGKGNYSSECETRPDEQYEVAVSGRRLQGTLRVMTPGTFGPGFINYAIRGTRLD